MAAMKTMIQREEIELTELESLKDLKHEFTKLLAGITFQRAQGILVLVMLFTCALLVYDYTSYQEGLWSFNAEYKQIFTWHLILGGGTGILLLASLLIKPCSENSRFMTAYTLGTAFFILCQPSFLAGGIAQHIQLQIIGYFLGVFGISALFYIRPLHLFFLYLGSYLVFIRGLRNFDLNGSLITSSSFDGLIFVVIAWFVSGRLYSHQFRDFKSKRLLEVLSQKRLETLEEDRNINQEKAYRLASIVETSDDGIIGMTREGIVMYWNPGAERIYGYSEKEIVGKSIFTVVPEELQSEAQEMIAKALRGEKVTNVETRRKAKDGRIAEISLTLSLIKDGSGSVIGMSCILRDISDKKTMERELARLDRLNLIGELAASISHEVRNPLATVRGFMQLLKEKKSCSEYVTYFDLMIEELDRANGILTEFLSITRCKSNERTSRDLNVIIRSLLPLLEANAVADDKKVQVRLQELPKIMVDDKEIRQVILNLSRNGIEAMEAGGVLTIRTSCQEGQIILEIEDQGCGMSPEVIERLGTPFFTTKSEGTGIGLAICYGIAARHNAKIDVESSNKGTTFRIAFPAG